jgi:crotonobetainyl-CoA:carnitine CoA-transferase CaiB-like acyl-CoA transferase
MDAAVRGWIAERSRDEAMAALVEADVVCSPINSVSDILADPHVAARENVVRLDSARGGEITLPGVVPRLRGEPGTVRWAGKDLGAANEDVFLGLLGLEPDEYDGLRATGVI